MVVIDVLNDAGGRELLFEKYGIRKVPVLAKGDRYAMGQMLEPFAKLAGIPLTALGGLTPEQLYRKYEMIFAAGQRLARQFPFPHWLRFTYHYFLKRGFLDGVEGYIFCHLLAEYEFWIWIRIVELRKQRKQAVASIT